MSANTVTATELRSKLAGDLGRGWRGLGACLRRSASSSGSELRTQCFGRLAERDEMIVKGLAARFACSSGRGLDR
jgi:hypothetical protein